MPKRRCPCRAPPSPAPPVQAWTDLNCVVFHGSEKARDMIVKHEFFFNSPNAQRVCVGPPCHGLP